MVDNKTMRKTAKNMYDLMLGIGALELQIKDWDSYLKHKDERDKAYLTLKGFAYRAIPAEDFLREKGLLKKYFAYIARIDEELGRISKKDIEEAKNDNN